MILQKDGRQVLVKDGGQVGEGGLSVVYKAEDTKLDRHVVLKFLSSHLTDNEE